MRGLKKHGSAPRPWGMRRVWSCTSTILQHRTSLQGKVLANTCYAETWNAQKTWLGPPAVGNEEGVVVYVHDPANLIARQSARKHLLRRDMEPPAKVRSRKELKCRLPPPGGKDVNIGMYGPWGFLHGDAITGKTGATQRK